MIVDTEWIASNFNRFNHLIWNGELPTPQFKTSMAKRSWGRAYYTIDRKNNCLKDFKIAISNYYDSPEWVKQNTLIHEMIHIADYFFHPEHFIGPRARWYNSHGWEFFLKEADRIKALGWDIEKKVTTEEVNVSCLSEKAQERVDRMRETQYLLYIGSVNRKISKKNGSIYDFTVVKPVGGLPTRKNYEMCKRIGMREIILVRTNADRYAMMRGSSRGGLYATIEQVNEVMACAEVICNAVTLEDMMSKKSR